MSEQRRSTMRREVAVVIANAIIWAAVVLATAHVLRGTGLFSDLLPIVGGGAAASVVVVSGGLMQKPRA
jgi:hypothetical protein